MTPDANPATEYTFQVVIDGQTYEGVVDSTKNNAGKFMLFNTNGDETDFFEMNRPSFGDIQDVVGTTAYSDTTSWAGAAAEASGPSYALGFTSTAFALRGGTTGGPQTIADMTGIQIAPNGVITGWDSQGKDIIIGRIDIVTFANPAGL
ncbi:MAG: hypothetical protein LBU87_02120, partial [Lactobacillales bacterium]|nr:hypothetical protein [Lactobacillales bacterium]